MKNLWIKSFLLPILFILFFATEAKSQYCHNTIWYTINDYTVDFTDSSAGRNFTYWLWDFGDGNTSTDSMPTHVYSKNGYFYVTLLAGDSSTGCYSSSQRSIAIGCIAKPHYNITYYKVSFTDNSNAGFNTWYWDFGDGDTSTLQNPQHTYKDSGTYKVKFIGYDSINNCTDSTIIQVYIKKLNCKGKISYSPNSDLKLMVFFVDSSIGQNINQWEWDYGDSSTALIGNRFAYYHYKKGGSYQVRLATGNYTTGCKDTTYVNIFLEKDCYAYLREPFVSNTAHNGKFYVSFLSDYGTYGCTNKYFDYGDGSDSTDSHSHYYAARGSYNVRLVGYDTTNGCRDTAYRMITIHDPECTASILVSSHGVQASFEGIRSPNDSLYRDHDNWSWDFGDNSQGKYGKIQQHNYSKYGSYLVTARIFNTLTGCRDTVDTIINISPPPPPPATVVGRILTDTFGMAHAKVWLIEYDSVAGTLTAIDSTITDSNIWNPGYFRFNNIDSGDYLIKAAFLPASNKYQDYLPTYYVDELFWNSATSVRLNSGYYNLNITLTAGNNPGGPGFIGGYVSQGANKRKGVGDPLENVQVMLLDLSDAPVAYTYSDENGYFSFSNVAFGTFKVYPEILGKETEPALVTLTNDKPVGDTVWMQVSETKVSTAIFNNNKFHPFKLYPNPANDLLKIEMPQEYAGNCEISITDITGKIVWLKQLSLSGSELEVDISRLNPGSYMLQLKTENNKVYRQKLLKQ